MSMVDRVKPQRAWAAMWYEFDRPMEHSVRRTRKEVAEYMAEAWGSWSRAYRRGCRIVPVEIRLLHSPDQKGERDA